MDYLLWSKEVVRSSDLSKGQKTLWEAVQRVCQGSDAQEIADELIEQEILTKTQLMELIIWIKNNRPKPRKRTIAKAFRRRGCY